MMNCVNPFEYFFFFKSTRMRARVVNSMPTHEVFVMQFSLDECVHRKTNKNMGLHNAACGRNGHGHHPTRAAGNCDTKYFHKPDFTYCSTNRLSLCGIHVIPIPCYDRWIRMSERIQLQINWCINADKSAYHFTSSIQRISWFDFMNRWSWIVGILAIKPSKPILIYTPVRGILSDTNIQRCCAGQTKKRSFVSFARFPSIYHKIAHTMNVLRAVKCPLFICRNGEALRA